MAPLRQTLNHFNFIRFQSANPSTLAVQRFLNDIISVSENIESCNVPFPDTIKNLIKTTNNIDQIDILADIQTGPQWTLRQISFDGGGSGRRGQSKLTDEINV
jgi:hypothetical protein